MRAVRKHGENKEALPTGLSETLGTLSDNISLERPTIGEILSFLGGSGLTLVLLLLSIPAIVPTPGVPAGMIFGTALALIALQMVVGATRFSLPAWVANIRITRSRLQNAIQRFQPFLKRVETWLQPRWTALTLPGPAQQLLGLVVCFMGVLIALPIPFGNTIPGLSVLAIALGLARQDGICVAAGLALAVAATAVSLALLAGGWWLVGAVLGWPATP